MRGDAPAEEIIHLAWSPVPYGSGPLSREHAGLSGGTKRPPSGSMYFERARLCGSVLPYRSTCILSDELRPAWHVVTPPRW